MRYLCVLERDSKNRIFVCLVMTQTLGCLFLVRSFQQPFSIQDRVLLIVTILVKSRFVKFASVSGLKTIIFIIIWIS